MTKKSVSNMADATVRLDPAHIYAAARSSATCRVFPQGVKAVRQVAEHRACLCHQPDFADDGRVRGLDFRDPHDVMRVAASDAILRARQSGDRGRHYLDRRSSSAPELGASGITSSNDFRTESNSPVARHRQEPPALWLLLEPEASRRGLEPKPSLR